MEGNSTELNLNTYQNSANLEIDELKQELFDKSTKIAFLTQTNLELNLEIELLTTTKQIKCNELTHSNLAQRNEDLRIKNSQLEMRCHELEDILDEIKFKYETSKKQLIKSQDELRANKTLNTESSFRNSMNDLKEALKDAEVKIKSHEAQIKSYGAFKDKMNLIKSLEEENRKLQRANNDLINESRDKNSTLKRNIFSLESSLSDSNTLLAIHIEKISTMDEQINSYKITTEGLKAQIEKLKEQNELLENFVGERSLREDWNDIDPENVEFNRNLRNLNNSRHNLESEMLSFSSLDLDATLIADEILSHENEIDAHLYSINKSITNDAVNLNEIIKNQAEEVEKLKNLLEDEKNKTLQKNHSCCEKTKMILAEEEKLLSSAFYNYGHQLHNKSVIKRNFDTLLNKYRKN